MSVLHLFLWSNKYSIVWTYHISFICSSVAGYKLSFKETRHTDFSPASRPFLNTDSALFVASKSSSLVWGIMLLFSLALIVRGRQLLWKVFCYDSPYSGRPPGSFTPWTDQAGVPRQPCPPPHLPELWHGGCALEELWDPQDLVWPLSFLLRYLFSITL